MNKLHVPRVAILASGSGTTAEAYAAAIHNGEVRHEIGLVITNNPDAGVLERVDRWNGDWGFDTEAVVVNRHTHPGGPNERGQTHEEAEAIIWLAERRNIDLIAAMGYMVIINNPLISQYGFVPGRHRSIYEARMVNTHPGPLPLTQDSIGAEASRIVLEEAARIEVENERRSANGESTASPLRQSEHTMHVISQVVDDPETVFARHPVPIMPGDTADDLFQRVQKIEKSMISYSLDMFLRRHRWALGSPTDQA